MSIVKREKPIVYVVQQLPDGPFKIGISKDPASYIKTMQEHNPNELVLRSMIVPGNLSAKTLEKRACAALSDYQIRNQWFDGLSLDTIEDTIKLEREGLNAKNGVVNTSHPYTGDVEEDLMEAMRVLHHYTSFDYVFVHDDSLGTRVIPKTALGKSSQADFSDLPNMKERIIKHIEKTHRYDMSISKDVELVLWIIEQTKEYNPLPFKERVYSALHGVSPICTYGKKKKFRTYREGYSKCHLEMCRCKREENRSTTLGVLYSI